MSHVNVISLMTLSVFNWFTLTSRINVCSHWEARHRLCGYNRPTIKAHDYLKSKPNSQEWKSSVRVNLRSGTWEERKKWIKKGRIKRQENMDSLRAFLQAVWPWDLRRITVGFEETTPAGRWLVSKLTIKPDISERHPSSGNKSSVWNKRLW